MSNLLGLYASIYSQWPATAIARWYCPTPGGACRPAKLEVRRTIGMAIQGPWAQARTQAALNQGLQTQTGELSLARLI